MKCREAHLLKAVDELESSLRSSSTLHHITPRSEVSTFPNPCALPPVLRSQRVQTDECTSCNTINADETQLERLRSALDARSSECKRLSDNFAALSTSNDQLRRQAFFRNFLGLVISFASFILRLLCFKNYSSVGFFCFFFFLIFYYFCIVLLY